MSSLIVLASRFDDAARSLAQRWDAALVTPVDLSSPGWLYRAPGFESGSILAGGLVIPNQDVRGVLTRLPVVDPQELDHVVVEDRDYAASEMTAFLLAWLSGLRCPVINRPSPECLCGPGWRLERWLRLAHQLGIPIHPVQRDSTTYEAGLPDATASITVLGDRCFHSSDPRLAAHAKILAAKAAVELVEIRFTGPAHDRRFLNVNLCPDLSDPHLADALAERLGAHVVC